jgi:hypothetical protein
MPTDHRPRTESDKRVVIWPTSYVASSTCCAISAGFAESTRSLSLPAILGSLILPRRCVSSRTRTAGQRSPSAHCGTRVPSYLRRKIGRDPGYQKNSLQIKIAFPPGTSQLYRTDQVPHALLAGQYALEQTFYLDIASIVDPMPAPLKVFERMTGRSLVN